jgi:hypothetical protein
MSASCFGEVYIGIVKVELQNQISNIKLIFMPDGTEIGSAP